jgi:putative two-component system response regulator
MCVITQVIDATMTAEDPYTVQHQQRATRVARSIAGQTGLPADSMEKLRIAGTLHDLGKISVANEILVKPGRLSDLEFAIIETHPLVGYDILNPLELPQSTSRTILQHHERWNGSGYPHGLSRDNIFQEARILGVADVV